jgi:uncharacterized protein YidB (DUF937 family)
MANPLLGQILANAFGNRMQGQSPMNSPGLGGGMGGLGGGLGGAALGSLIAGLAGRRTGGLGGGMRPSGNRGLLLALMLPLAMRWVQRNGGIGSVLDRFRQRGLGDQAHSWVSTGPNRDVSAQDVQSVVGQDEIAQFASQLGVPQEDVAQAFAEILPELTDKLTPDGKVTEESREALDAGQSTLERELADLHREMQAQNVG